MPFERQWLNNRTILSYKIESLDTYDLMDWSNDVVSNITNWKPHGHYLVLFDLSMPGVSLPFLVLTRRDLFNVGLTHIGKIRIMQHLEKLSKKKLYFALVLSHSASGTVLQKYHNTHSGDDRITGKVFFHSDYAVKWLSSQDFSVRTSVTRPIKLDNMLKVVRAMNDNDPTAVKVGTVITMLINNAVESVDFSDKESLIVGRRLSNSKSTNQKIMLDLSGYGMDSQSVSRKHAMLSIEDSYLYVTDLNSTNGTYINSKRLNPNIPYLVRRDDKILFGTISITILF